MWHDYDVRVINDVTIMFCRRCGVSFKYDELKVVHQGVWQQMLFKTSDNREMPQPVRCDERELGK